MPGVQPSRELYLATNIGELNKLTELQPLQSSVSTAVKSAGKLLNSAELCENTGDEEKAYVLYMRFFNLITSVKRTSEYKKDEQYYNKMVGFKNLKKAIKRAESLQKSLNYRYDFLKAQAYSEKLKKEKEEGEKNNKPQELNSNEKILEVTKEMKHVSDKNEVTPFYCDKRIFVMELFALLNDGRSKIVIMDIRSADQFAESRLKYKETINVPVDIIPPGTTVPHIEENLPKDSRNLWSKRGTVNYIILMDLNSTRDTVLPGTPLKTLQDALYKYDSCMVLHNEPLILEGGYEQWMLHYPQMTTCPMEFDTLHVRCASLKLDFDYPELDAIMANKCTECPQKKDIPTTTTTTTSTTTSTNTTPTSPSISGGTPVVNRALKPKSTGASPVLTSMSSSEDSSSQQSVSPVPSTLPSSRPPPKMSTLKSSSDSKLCNVDGGLDYLTDMPSASSARFQSMNQHPRAPTMGKEEVAKYNKRRQEMLAKGGEHANTTEDVKLRDKEQKNLALLSQNHRMTGEGFKSSMRHDNFLPGKTEENKSLPTSVIEDGNKIAGTIESAPKSDGPTGTTTLVYKPLPSKPSMKVSKNMESLKDQYQGEKANTDQTQKEKTKDDCDSPVLRRVKPSVTPLREVPDTLSKEQRAFKEAEEKAKRLLESNKSKLIPSPTLPHNWEKRLDSTTNRYYYVHHPSDIIHWTPPPQQSREKEVVYKMKLKDESPAPSSGMKRSHSSPDISQLLSNDCRGRPRPLVDRSTKPNLGGSHIALYSKPNPNQARVRNLNPVYGNVLNGLTGLKNIGNTCYMNSIIQCLSNTHSLLRYFLQDVYLNHVNRNSVLGDSGEVVDEFAVIVKALWSGQYKCITPRDFKNTVGKYAPMFAGFDQHDSQEFLTFLLDQLHEGLNLVNKREPVPEQENENLPEDVAADLAWEAYEKLNKSIIVSLFQGQLKSTLCCLACKKESITFQTFQYLSLPIPTTTKCKLQDCLELFLKEEEMTGDSRWNCPQCKRQRDTAKKMDIWKLPSVLLIGLSRFSHEGVWRHKLNTFVDFPIETLDMSNYVCSSNSKAVYQLFAVSNHYGTMKGGHYISFCKNPSLKKWYKFDDQEISEMIAPEVKTSAAFVLFYTIRV
ncbi:ubiquitin carboxyl-terminal hydrolase 8-like [Argonauta hians]